MCGHCERRQRPWWVRALDIPPGAVGVMAMIAGVVWTLVFLRDGGLI